MKRTVCLFAGLLLMGVAAHAQKKSSGMFAELSVGPSFPIGKFAEKSFKSYTEDDPGGCAKTGLAMNATIGYRLNETAGLLLIAGYSVNKQDADSYEDYMKKSWFSNPSRVDVDAKSWKIFRAMAGGFFVTPLTANEELSLVTKLAAGVCKTAIPEFSWTGYDQNGMMLGTGTQNKEKLSWAFCYQVNVGLQYKLNNKLHVFFDINSFNATVHKDYTYNPNPVSSGPVEMTTVKRKFRLASVNALAGIGIDL